MSGKLYLCATPIGNLEDITLRVLRTLKEVDLIAAEDTRNSIKLLNHFDIKTPMTSYHEYNKIDKAYVLINKMQEGQNIALITDAGTPGISDPGEELAAMCYEAGIEVTSLPGPAACITALTLSGLPTRRFAFEAFLPADKKERKQILEELKNETRTIILYEAPHRLVRTLEELKETLGNRRMTLCRELTKKHETAFHSTIDDLILYYQTEKPLGECVLVIEGRNRKEMEEEQKAAAKEAERVVAEAQAQAEQIVAEANAEAARIMTMAKEKADNTLSEAEAASQHMTDTAQKKAEVLKAQSEDKAQTCVELAQKQSQDMITAAEQKRDQLEEACREKSEETQKELEARWDAFEKRVGDVLSQHRELSMLLKNVTAKPIMVSEPVDSAVSKQMEPETLTTEKEQMLNGADE